MLDLKVLTSACRPMKLHVAPSLRVHHGAGAIYGCRDVHARQHVHTGHGPIGPFATVAPGNKPAPDRPTKLQNAPTPLTWTRSMLPQHVLAL
jgi:hypothetical protein